MSFPWGLSPISPISPALVFDTTAPDTFVGVFSKKRWLATFHSEATALEAFFEGVEACLHEAHLELSDIQACFYCEGPGSTLGLRIARMALEAWSALLPRPWAVFPYNTFDWLLEQLQQAGHKNVHVLSEYKQGQWQYVSLVDGLATPPVYCQAQELLALKPPVYHLKLRSQWPLPPIAVLPIRGLGRWV